MVNPTSPDNERTPSITQEQAAMLRELLDDIAAVFRRYVVLPRHSAETIALYVFCTWLIDIAYYAPLLILKSPEMRCGKTTTLEIIASIVREPVATSNCSTSALFREIHKKRCTVLMDEVDTYLRTGGERAEDIRSILNAGYRNDVFSCVTRSEAKASSYEPTTFSVFGFKILAGIGSMHATVQDRSIQIPMRRKREDEHVDRLRMKLESSTFKEFSRRCETIAQEIAGAAEIVDPETPECLSDREKDNWELMFAVADLACGHWPQTAREAAIAFSVGQDVDSSPVLLLRDIQSWFREQPQLEFAPTNDLLRYLHRLDTRTWGAWARKEEPMTPRQLAAILQPFGVKPTQRKLNGSPVRGYHKASFTDPFERYCGQPTNADSPLPEASKVITIEDLLGNRSGNEYGVHPLPEGGPYEGGNGTKRFP